VCLQNPSSRDLVQPCESVESSGQQFSLNLLPLSHFLLASLAVRTTKAREDNRLDTFGVCVLVSYDERAVSILVRHSLSPRSLAFHPIGTQMIQIAYRLVHLDLVWSAFKKCLLAQRCPFVGLTVLLGQNACLVLTFGDFLVSLRF
jgi:hypothetical protein